MPVCPGWHAAASLSHSAFHRSKSSSAADVTDRPCPPDLAEIAVGQHPGGEGHQVTTRDRPSLRARRHGCSFDVTHAPSWVAGVLTPPAACASSITPVNACSVVPSAQLADRRGQPSPGDAQRAAERGDLVGSLDPAGRAHRQLTVDEFGVRERHRQQLGE